MDDGASRLGQQDDPEGESMEEDPPLCLTTLPHDLLARFLVHKFGLRVVLVVVRYLHGRVLSKGPDAR
eukprot:8469407-Pyramimonas_sp.AAC.1